MIPLQDIEGLGSWPQLDRLLNAPASDAGP
jgi:hypothetical protein